MAAYAQRVFGTRTALWGSITDELAINVIRAGTARQTTPQTGTARQTVPQTGTARKAQV